MLLDKKQIFSGSLSGSTFTGQSVVINAAADADSTNYWDFGTDGLSFKNATKYADINDNGKHRFYIVAATALSAAVDGAVLTIGIYTNSSAASSGGTLIASKAVTVNTIATGATAAGTVLAELWLPSNITTQRYLLINYAVATQNITAGTVYAVYTDGVYKGAD